MSLFDETLECALRLDQKDPLRSFREKFHFPETPKNKECLYFVGNSLGLQPKRAKEFILQELNDWERYAVEGHFHAKTPWYSCHESVSESTARLVGAKPSEVVVMNSLTVNLHLMMISFYRPTRTRYRILMESGAFPSDQYAVASQVSLHGLNPKDAVVELKPREGEDTLRHEDILQAIAKEGDSLQLVLLGDVNYRTGQAFLLREIAEAAHRVGAYFGADLAHGAGNLLLSLHDDNVDFAVWCSYKYLNAGPGAIAGCFVHEMHSARFDWPRLAGWWGHDKAQRFLMESDFRPMLGAEGWQLSNPAIVSLAALRASMEIFDEATMARIREKSVKLTGYLEFLLLHVPKSPYRLLTPRHPEERGAHLSVWIGSQGKAFVERMKTEGIFCDYREPGIVRVAPVALYNSFQDVFAFVKWLRNDAIHSRLMPSTNR